MHYFLALNDNAQCLFVPKNTVQFFFAPDHTVQYFLAPNDSAQCLFVPNDTVQCFFAPEFQASLPLSPVIITSRIDLPCKSMNVWMCLRKDGKLTQGLGCDLFKKDVNLLIRMVAQFFLAGQSARSDDLQDCDEGLDNALPQNMHDNLKDLKICMVISCRTICKLVDFVYDEASWHRPRGRERWIIWWKLEQSVWGPGRFLVSCVCDIFQDRIVGEYLHLRTSLESNLSSLL